MPRIWETGKEDLPDVWECIQDSSLALQDKQAASCDKDPPVLRALKVVLAACDKALANCRGYTPRQRHDEELDVMQRAQPPFSMPPTPISCDEDIPVDLYEDLQIRRPHPNIVATDCTDETRQSIVLDDHLQPQSGPEAVVREHSLPACDPATLQPSFQQQLVNDGPAPNNHAPSSKFPVTFTNSAKLRPELIKHQERAMHTEATGDSADEDFRAIEETRADIPWSDKEWISLFRLVSRFALPTCAVAKDCTLNGDELLELHCSNGYRRELDDVMIQKTYMIRLIRAGWTVEEYWQEIKVGEMRAWEGIEWNTEERHGKVLCIL